MSLLDLINKQRAKLQRNNTNRPEKLHSEKNLIRVLPSWDGTEDGQFSQEWGQHFIKDAAGNLKAVYICTQTCFEEGCPVCEALAQGAAMNSDEDILKALKDARSSKRILINTLYLKGGKHDNPETNPVVLDIPPTVWDSILATASAYLAEGINVFDLKEGINFIVEKTGTGMNTEYKVTPAPRASAVKADVMTKVQDLTQWARQESETERAKAITSVRTISGAPMPATHTPPKLITAERSESKLAKVDPSEIIEVEEASLSAELDDFLKDL